MNVPNIKTTKELKTYLAEYYIIDEYMDSYEHFSEFQEYMYTLIKGCYERKVLRKFPIRFKFYDSDMKFYSLELRHFVINLFYWYPFVELHGIRHVFDETFIIQPYDIPKLNNKINHLIWILREYGVKNVKINYNISQVLYNMRRISGDFSMIMGLNFDMVTIIEMYNNYPEFRDIMETQIDENMQPIEIEKVLDKKQKELIEFLESLPDNPIGVILRSGTGIKHKQLAEFLISKGLFPDLSGNTIPLPIKGSTVLGGLRTAADLYIDGNGARKSLIMSHKVMGKAGHFGKVLTELSRTLKLSKTVSDCGSKHLVKYFVTGKDFLEKFDGKFFTLNKDDLYSLRPINSEKDRDLIGKTIYVRSVATCGLNNSVCPKCFGLNANLNFDIADGIGAFSTEEVTKVMEQNILSTKHLLTTKSEEIIFNNIFYKFFSITSDEINPIINYSELDDIDDWVIVINKDNLVKNDEMDSDESFNTYISDGSFSIKNVKTKEEHIIQEKNGKEIFLTDDCLQLLKKGKGQIYFKDMDDDTVLFVMTILNNELTKPLYELMNLVNRDKKSVVDRNIDDLSQKMIELFIESGIDASATSAEIIINRLIRKEDNIFERPDFSSNRLPKYKIVTVAKALEKNKSPLVGLSYQYVKRQLLSDDIDKKDATSYLDPFFKEKIYTKKRKEHIRHVMEQKRKEIKNET